MTFTSRAHCHKCLRAFPIPSILSFSTQESLWKCKWELQYYSKNLQCDLFLKELIIYTYLYIVNHLGSDFDSWHWDWSFFSFSCPRAVRKAPNDSSANTLECLKLSNISTMEVTPNCSVSAKQHLTEAWKERYFACQDFYTPCTYINSLYSLNQARITCTLTLTWLQILGLGIILYNNTLILETILIFLMTSKALA